MQRSKEIKDFIEKVFNTDIEANVASDTCVMCKREIGKDEGWKEIEVREYRISGLCNFCQKKVFRDE